MDSKISVSLSDVASWVVLIMSLLVMSGWLFNFPELLNLVSGSATMKFNTALLFFFSGLSMLIREKEEFLFHILSVGLSLLILIVGLWTLAEYYLPLPFWLDNIFVLDAISTAQPGRMSPATSVCFVLFGFGQFSIYRLPNMSKKLIQVLFLIVIALSITAIISYGLEVPLGNKTLFFDTMAIHTSTLFLLIAGVSVVRYQDVGFIGLLTGLHAGSKLLRTFLPLAVGVPIILSFLYLTLVSQEWIHKDFGMVLYTVVFIFISVLYISLVARGLNKSDIERKDLEDRLIATNAELKQFNEALDQVAIVAITDAKGVIKYVNDNFCHISKYDRNELIGNTHQLINSGHHTRDFFADLWQTIGRGNVWIGEIKNKAKDGSFYWVHTAIVPFKNEDGKIHEYLAIRQDITQKKESEEQLSTLYVVELEKKNTELLQKNRELEQFAYIASHDLQEPLRTIMSFTNLLSSKLNGQGDDIVEKSMRFITEGSDRMSQLITGLLEYSRIGRDSKKAIVDCNELIAKVKQSLMTEISDSRTVLELNDLPKIEGYETDLRVLFQHLIGNAIKFSKDDTSPVIHISAENMDNQWKFAVKDNGIGIENRFTERVFTIYQRLHKRGTYNGTGVGLAYCRKIAHLHGGKIWVESEPQKGSTFFFTIPK